VNDCEIDWCDLDPEFEGEGGDGFAYDSSDCDAEWDTNTEVELLGDSAVADYDTEEEEAAAAWSARYQGFCRHPN
jgi:hypothetical protein